MPINFSYQIKYQTASENDLMRDPNIPSIAIGQNSTTISIPIVNDNFRENAETFTITLMNPSPSGTIITNSTATGTIAENDLTGLSAITIAEARGEEGSNLIFKVMASATISEPINFQYEATLDNMSTASRADLSGELTGTMQIAPNDSSTTISIATANDSLREADETFRITLSKLTPITDATFTDHTAIGTISANDNNATGIVIISVADATANEDASTINFQVSSKFPAVTGSQFTFDYEATLDIGNQDNSADTNDFTTEKGTATIPADASSTTISIRLKSDNTVEAKRDF